MKVLALDFGSARTGVAVSDPTGSVARPIGVVDHAASEAGIARVLELARQEEAELIVVGLPITLRGERGAQAEETERFVEHFLDQAVALVAVEIRVFRVAQVLDDQADFPSQDVAFQLSDARQVELVDKLGMDSPLDVLEFGFLILGG